MTNIEEILEKIRGIESTDEIKVVVDAIENRRKELIDIDLSNFAKQAESLAKLHGVESVEALLELTKTRKKRSRRSPPKNPPKYANPSDPTDTYSGFGRQKKFVTDYLAADPSHKLEDLLINK